MKWIPIEHIHLHQKYSSFYILSLELILDFFLCSEQNVIVHGCSLVDKISKLCRKTELICMYFKDSWYSVLRNNTYIFIVFCIVTSFSLSGMLEMGKFSKPYSKDMDNLLKHLPILEVNPTGLLLKILYSIVRCNVPI